MSEEQKTNFKACEQRIKELQKALEYANVVIFIGTAGNVCGYMRNDKNFIGLPSHFVVRVSSIKHFLLKAGNLHNWKKLS
jgi:hypothetical protein